MSPSITDGGDFNGRGGRQKKASQTHAQLSALPLTSEFHSGFWNRFSFSCALECMTKAFPSCPKPSLLMHGNCQRYAAAERHQCLHSFHGRVGALDSSPTLNRETTKDGEGDFLNWPAGRLLNRPFFFF